MNNTNTRVAGAEPLLYRDIYTHDADGGISALPEREPPPMFKDRGTSLETRQTIPGTGEIFADDAWEVTRVIGIQSSLFLIRVLILHITFGQ